MNITTISPDFLIVGSGVAGLNAALHAGRYGKVHLLTKASLQHSSSYRAQGGIAAVLEGEDSFQSHIKDTLVAGRGFCNPEAVELLVKEGAEEVRRLVDLGMPFDRSGGRLDLGLEGGHSNRRVLHADGAATGKALIDFLSGLVKAHPNISVSEQAFVYQLAEAGGRCRGAAAYLYQKEELMHIESPVTVLASGGYSALYHRSTNPHTSTGDGLWLGYNIGARLKDLEFVQFHPTAFYADEGASFLISEAVRGEGARLFNAKGERFMAGRDQQELAPRDVVSREIFLQIQKQRAECVYLDVRHLDTGRLRAHFPNLMSRIEEQGVDIEREGIPVAPAAHYCIGGLETGLNAQTTIPGLYACGETAATGVHGANRLASNSLLECLVFSKRAIEHARVRPNKASNTVFSPFSLQPDGRKTFSGLQQRVSGILSRYVAIQRDETGLKYAAKVLTELSDQKAYDPAEYYGIRSKGLVKLAEMIINSALIREESRGVHTRADFPERRAGAQRITYKKEVRQQELT